eukprot:scaffold121813_cov39-Tisochrysis_lutea.AAC.3
MVAGAHHDTCEVLVLPLVDAHRSVCLYKGTGRRESTAKAEASEASDGRGQRKSHIENLRTDAPEPAEVLAVVWWKTIVRLRGGVLHHDFGVVPPTAVVVARRSPCAPVLPYRVALNKEHVRLAAFVLSWRLDHMASRKLLLDCPLVVGVVDSRPLGPAAFCGPAPLARPLAPRASYDGRVRPHPLSKEAEHNGLHLRHRPPERASRGISRKQ